MSEQRDLLKKEVSKLKFKASQRATDLHDLIEDRLWSDFEDIPKFSEELYKACQEWKAKEKEFDAVKDI